MKEAPKRAHEPWKAFQARQRNQDIKRDAVLQTAAHMFLEQGYRRTSMSELAKRLQITKPALYYYFHNKEQILVECYRELGMTATDAHLQALLTYSVYIGALHIRSSDVPWLQKPSDVRNYVNHAGRVLVDALTR